MIILADVKKISRWVELIAPWNLRTFRQGKISLSELCPAICFPRRSRLTPPVSRPTLAPSPPVAPTLNPTHDPARLCWLESANAATTDFPLQNLPYGVFRPAADSAAHLGVAIGDRILDLQAAAAAGLLPVTVTAACQQPTLNALLALGAPVWSALRARLSELLGADTCPAGALRDRVAACLVPMNEATMLLPAAIGDYTDFYASISHATNVGAMFRP